MTPERALAGAGSCTCTHSEQRASPPWSLAAMTRPGTTRTGPGACRTRSSACCRRPSSCGSATARTPTSPWCARSAHSGTRRRCAAAAGRAWQRVRLSIEHWPSACLLLSGTAKQSCHAHHTGMPVKLQTDLLLTTLRLAGRSRGAAALPGQPGSPGRRLRHGRLRPILVQC